MATINESVVSALDTARAAVTVGRTSIGSDTVAVIAAIPVPDGQHDGALRDAARSLASSGAHVLAASAVDPGVRTFESLRAALRALAVAGAESGMPVACEALSPAEVELVAGCAELLCIRSRDMQSHALLREAAGSRLPVLLERERSATVREWLRAAAQLLELGARDVLLCERGIRTFEPSSPLTLDLNAVALARELSPVPVVVDASRATAHSGLVPAMCLAAAAAGAQGVVVEVNPLCSARCSTPALDLDEFGRLLGRLRAVSGATAAAREPAVSS